MFVLIDYDNLDLLERRHGVRHVMTSLLQALGRERLGGQVSVECRLYGGWFQETAISPSAQQLLPELRRNFPSSMAIADQKGTEIVLVRAQLALALACDPRVELTHTYRRRSLPPSLRCIPAPFPGCSDPTNCPIADLDPFMQHGTCPEGRCVVTPRGVLQRAEQKLVDSMIVIDLVHLAGASSEPLVVVSADDDIWPGIRFVLLRGARVVHVIPRRGGSVPHRYRRLTTSGYARIAI